MVRAVFQHNEEYDSFTFRWSMRFSLAHQALASFSHLVSFHKL